jgi:regulator of protease activity HflC (stomatin/prohibitin superfamily)
MMPHDTPAKAQAARELREERARAFWQAQINEGRARAAEQQARTNKQAAPPLEPPPSPPPPSRVPLHLVSAEAPPTAETQPIDPSHLAGLSPTAVAILELINAGTADGRRYTATPPIPDRSAWRIVQRHIPTLTDQQAQTVIDTWLQKGVLELKTYRDPLNRRDTQGLFASSPASPQR